MKAVATSLRESPSSYRYLNDDIKTLVLKDPKEWKDEDLNRITANVLKNDTLSISNKEAIAILNTYKKKTASAAGAGGAAGTASSVPTQMNFNGISVNI
jgi:predicted nucleic-acid-binding protein